MKQSFLTETIFPEHNKVVLMRDPNLTLKKKGNYKFIIRSKQDTHPSLLDEGLGLSTLSLHFLA